MGWRPSRRKTQHGEIRRCVFFKVLAVTRYYRLGITMNFVGGGVPDNPLVHKNLGQSAYREKKHYKTSASSSEL